MNYTLAICTVGSGSYFPCLLTCLGGGSCLLNWSLPISAATLSLWCAWWTVYSLKYCLVNFQFLYVKTILKMLKAATEAIYLLQKQDCTLGRWGKERSLMSVGIKMLMIKVKINFKKKFFIHFYSISIRGIECARKHLQVLSSHSRTLPNVEAVAASQFPS